MGYQDVIDFWFTEIKPAQWWVKDKIFDNEIRTRFGNVHKSATQCELEFWRESPQGRLAEIIVLDQFSRNMYRNTPQSFAYDGIALALAQEAIASGADKILSTTEKSFLYMPFMHSESLLIHEKSLELFKSNDTNVDFEIKHHKIIARFGRYPHRNIILNRKSTAAEVEFLTEPNSSF